MADHPLPTTLEEARTIVTAWRWDDEELRIPMTPWGHQLAAAVDFLLGVTSPQPA